MNKKLFHLTVLLIVVSFGMTSSMAQNHSPFTPKFSHKKSKTVHSRHLEKNRHHAEKALFPERQLDTINPLLPKQIEQLLTASSDVQLITIAIQDIPIPILLSPTVIPKKEKNIVVKSNPVENNSEIKVAELKNENLKSSHERKGKLLRAVLHEVHNNRLLCGIVAFFIPPLGVILYENKITSHFWICLILTLLFWLPGFIYALIIILG